MKALRQTLRHFPALVVALVAALASSSFPAGAVHEKDGGKWPWNLKLHGHQDREIAEDLGTGWFLNLGPTGIRAQITRDQPKYFTVRYVFRGSPASGQVAINDVIIGANAKRMNVAHYFGRGSRGRGTWAGPMVEMSKLIEDSQAAEGRLELIIWPGGDRAKEKTVTVQIGAIGRFSPTWPYDCKRSDKLMLELCEFLYEEHKRAGNFGRPHGNAAAVLALMGSNVTKYERLAFDIVRGYSGNRYDPLNGNGFPVWNYGHEGILLGEYYLLTQDQRVLPAIQSLVDCLLVSQRPEAGSYSHRPGPFLMRRIAEGGPKGYGAMSLTGSIAMTAMSLFKEAGLEYGEEAYKQLYQAHLRSVDENGGIDYGFKGLDHAMITLTGPNAKTSNSRKGIGFPIEAGMKDIGPYDVTWPTKADPRYRPTDWLQKEAETNQVFDYGGAKRLVIRSMPEKDPKEPFRHAGGRVGHLARSGAGALAMSIGNGGNRPWNLLSDHLATGCAKSPESLLDGHASTHMHVIFGSLGAALASEEDFRDYMEGIKWWFIMAHTHNGGFVVMPGRDYASTDHVYGTRVFPTGCAAVILALKEKRLQVTGAPRRMGGGDPVPSASHSAGRPARALAAEKRALLDQSLIIALAELSHAGEIKPLPMSLSKASTRVWLSKVESDARLVFQATEGGQQASFLLGDLSPADHVLLARLVARLRPDNAEAQASAGIYLEISGDTLTADEYYKNAGEEFQAMLGELFE